MRLSSVGGLGVPHILQPGPSVPRLGESCSSSGTPPPRGHRHREKGLAAPGPSLLQRVLGPQSELMKGPRGLTSCPECREPDPRAP